MKRLLFITLIGIMSLSCDKDSKCNNCGDVFGGMIVMKVSENDLSKYEGLAQISGVTVGTCIQAYIYNEELSLQSVTVLDACCCEF
ncbi:MAG: hypothetical protein QF418_05000 [Candidatus Marinimicrobia bacterium]|nr:hypothetical protein [Candidatus Neomarinimicrobiota bacterium]MDP6992456.1 hypothetical protein [Candidatus Neomarinimicrobiota bacterium]